MKGDTTRYRKAALYEGLSRENQTGPKSPHAIHNQTKQAEDVRRPRSAYVFGLLCLIVYCVRAFRACLIFSTEPFVQSCLTISGRVAFHNELASQLQFIERFGRLRVAQFHFCV